MCKHVAAVLYGVGARLDQQPELLFLLRKVDHLQLIEKALPQHAAKKAAKGKKTLAAGDVAGVFGIELAEPEALDAPAPAAKGKPAKSKQKKSGKSTSAAKAAPARSKGSRGALQPRKAATAGTEA
jgi:uncharacterized Zn finger protein